MKIKATANISPTGMLGSVGVPNAQKIFAIECARQMDRYVPMQQGVLKNTAIISPDGTEITYQTPYARNMYYGMVMVDPLTKKAGFLTADGWKSRKGVKKIVSNREYKYGNGKLRGKLWDVRMWSDRGPVIIKFVKNYLRGGV